MTPTADRAATLAIVVGTAWLTVMAVGGVRWLSGWGAPDAPARAETPTSAPAPTATLPEAPRSPPPHVDPHVDDPLEAMALALFEERHGIRIAFEGPASVSFRTSTMHADLRLWALELAEAYVAAYPDGRLRGVVDTIVFVEMAADVHGLVGGFTPHRDRTIVVAVHGRRHHDAVLGTMHHETGHVLHRQLDLDPERWAVENDRPYVGTTTWRSADTRRTAGRRRGWDPQAPYVSPYATAAFEEDVAETFVACTVGRHRDVPFPPGAATKLRLLEDAVRKRWPGFACTTALERR